MTTALLGCTALVAVSTGAHAQDAENAAETTAIRLNPVTLQARGSVDDDANSIVARELWVGGKVATSILDTPASVSVITGKEIQDRDAETLEEVLQYSAGIVTDYYGTDDRNDYFLVRGFQATTYRDGLTLGSMRGVREEPFAYERVEVIRGGNSTLFGAADPGGTINFVTKTPKFERIAEAYLSYGSFNHAEVGVDYGDVLNADQTMAYRFTAKVQDSDLEYDHSKDNSTFLMGGLTWQPTDATTLSLVVDYLKRDGTPNSGGYPFIGEYDRSDFFGEPDFNYHDVERTSVTTMLSHDFGTGLSLQANLRYSDLTDNYGYAYIENRSPRVGTTVERGAMATDRSAEEVIGNAILKYDTSFDSVDSSTLAGIEFRDASTKDTSYFGALPAIDTVNPVYAGRPSVSVTGESENDYSTQSLFVQQNLAFDDRFIATIGLRHDWMDVAIKGYDWQGAFDKQDDFSETSVRAALTYKVTDEISTYLSYVESVAPPSDASSTFGFDPARGDQYELGVKYAPAGMDALFSAAIYELNKKNETRTYWPAGSSTFELTNIDARVRGLDLEAKAEIDENFSVIAAYSYMDTEILRGQDYGSGADLAGNELGSVPNHTASIWVNYSLAGEGARGDITLGLGARYVGSYYFSDSNDEGTYKAAGDNGKSSAATLLDAAFTYEVQDGTDLAINVSNLLDEQHVVGGASAYYYNPGREIQATLRHRF
nr:TonB-dependent siderophore receptor [Paracoccus aestuariivivens]